MPKLWQKSYRLNEQVERFEGAQNSALDTRLIRHDVWGSLAHAAMLAHIGVLTDDEHVALKDALCNILALEEAHEFTIAPSDEDVHTSIENYLAAMTGVAGKKIHMARSRNDQVLVDLRLYGKEQLHSVADKLCHLCAVLLEFAGTHADVPMPGYTHMQRAMLSSLGLWAAAFAESLLDDEQLLATAQAQGLQLTGESGSTCYQGMDFTWNYDAGAQALTIQCVEKPMFVPCNMIEVRIRGLVGG